MTEYEGRQDHIRDLALPGIDVFRNIYPEADYTVSFEIPEFTAVCPKTGLPDFGTIYIDYKPGDNCAELKSLKEYITAFRNIGIFHENVVNRVASDFIRDVNPRWLRVRADYNVRGGIHTSVEREWQPSVSG